MPTHPPFPLRAHVKRRLDTDGLEFLAAFLACETARNPGNLAALAELAHVLTRLGRVEEGLSADRRLVELAPESPTVHYNLACSLCLSGHASSAIEELERAIELGYTDVEHLLEDDDLISLRPDSRFQRLVELLRTA